MPDHVMIDVRSLVKRYGRRMPVVALRDITMSVMRGSVTAVVGPNGAGKTTLFGVMLGFLHASSGDVSIADMHPRDYVLDHGIGYVPDRFSLPSGWPLGRALLALGRMNGLTDVEVDASISAFGLDSERTKKAGTLSRGLMQRAGLAQAFAASRELLFLDEPAEGLDPVWRIRLRERIAEQRAAGHTILLASHDIEEVERIADTVIILDRGAVKEVVDMKSAASQQTYYRITLQQAFVPFPNIFPGAAEDPSLTYRVAVRDATDLNTRIAELIELGGIVASMTPDNEPLEQRVRRTIES